MSLPIRPLAVSLTIALLGAVGMASAAPAATQDPQPRTDHQAPPAQARQPRVRPQQEHPRPVRQARQRSQDPLSDSIRRVERRTRGQVVSAERVPYDGRSVSRVKVVDDQGRVRIYMDDPQTAGSDPRTRRDDD